MKKFNLLMLLFTVISVNAQWSFDSLNTAASILWSESAGVRAVFTNGTEWDVFDVATHTHTNGLMSISRSMIKSVQYGDDVYFAGGKYGYFADPQYTKLIDVYDASTDTWETLNLSKNREVGGAGAIGGKVLFAGGTGRSDISGPVYLYNTVDIFDAVTGTRTTSKLKKARSNISVGAAGNKIVFAGGWFWDAYYNVKQAANVDIYNTTTGVWTQATLSKKRESMSVAVVGSKIIFAGGVGASGAMKNVDIYNVSTNTWSTSSMSMADYGMQSVVLGGNAFFGGGVNGGNKIQRYDPATNTWSIITLPVNVNNFKMEIIDNKIFCAGGFDVVLNDYSDHVQIYDPATLSWSNNYLSIARTLAGSTVVGNVGLFAGGNIGYVYPTTINTNRVDIYTAPMRLAGANEGIQDEVEKLLMEIYPNPVSDALNIMLPETFSLPALCTMYDINGQEVMSVQLYDVSTRIYVDDLVIGQYLLQVINSDRTLMMEKIIIKK